MAIASHAIGKGSTDPPGCASFGVPLPACARQQVSPARSPAASGRIYREHRGHRTCTVFSDGLFLETSSPMGSFQKREALQTIQTAHTAHTARNGPKYGFSFVVLHEEPPMTGFLRPYPRHRATGSRVRGCEQGLSLKPTFACIAEKLKVQHIDEKPV